MSRFYRALSPKLSILYLLSYIVLPQKYEHTHDRLVKFLIKIDDCIINLQSWVYLIIEMNECELEYVRVGSRIRSEASWCVGELVTDAATSNW